MCTQPFLSDRIEIGIGIIGEKVSEEFPSQECSFTLIIMSPLKIVWDVSWDQNSVCGLVFFCFYSIARLWTFLILQHTPSPSLDQDFIRQLCRCFICGLVQLGQESQLWYEMQTVHFLRTLCEINKPSSEKFPPLLIHQNVFNPNLITKSKGR